MYLFMNLQLLYRWFYHGSSIVSSCIASIRFDGSDSRFFPTACKSADPADRFNCTWSLLLFAEPTFFIFPRDRFACSTGVCFRVPPALFYSFERRRYLRSHEFTKHDHNSPRILYWIIIVLDYNISTD